MANYILYTRFIRFSFHHYCQEIRSGLVWLMPIERNPEKKSRRRLTSLIVTGASITGEIIVRILPVL